tara:strand:- start:1483 stop:1716 length:234 start_codon:yes stop_codon:yes gene_type:complete
MTNNNLLYMDQEEILDEYYKRILLIDNDMYTSNNIEEDRTKFINKVIDILEEYPDLCTSDSGDGFLRTILYPIMRMN